jgi:RNA polymerase sigma-70 factor (ECF subfamily)
LRADPAERFERLLREHQSMVFSLALRFLRDRAVAEELAQDVFLKLYEMLGELETDEHVRFWLRRVTCNRSIDESRKRKIRPRLTLAEIPEPGVRPHTGDPLMSDVLRKLVAALPERARAIVVMRYQEDLDPAEISRILDMPASSVKSLLHRSLHVLRGKLERATKQQRQEAAV